jgi:hypothetical protein
MVPQALWIRSGSAGECLRGSPGAARSRCSSRSWMRKIGPCRRGCTRDWEELGQGERDRLLQEAVRILRTWGWRRPELAGEDLERMMKELQMTQSFGPERLRKHCERLETQGAREGSALGGRCWGGEPGEGSPIPSCGGGNQSSRRWVGRSSPSF